MKFDDAMVGVNTIAESIDAHQRQGPWGISPYTMLSCQDRVRRDEYVFWVYDSCDPHLGEPRCD